LEIVNSWVVGILQTSVLPLQLISCVWKFNGRLNSFVCVALLDLITFVGGGVWSNTRGFIDGHPFFIVGASKAASQSTLSLSTIHCLITSTCRLIEAETLVLCCVQPLKHWCFEDLCSDLGLFDNEFSTLQQPAHKRCGGNLSMSKQQPQSQGDEQVHLAGTGATPSSSSWPTSNTTSWFLLRVFLLALIADG